MPVLLDRRRRGIISGATLVLRRSQDKYKDLHRQGLVEELFFRANRYTGEAYAPQPHAEQKAAQRAIRLLRDPFDASGRYVGAPLVRVALLHSPV